VQVLMQDLADEVRRSDAPELVERAVRDEEAALRQTPGAALEAMAMARDPDTPLARLEGVFQRDPMLAQSLLRSANSAFHRRDGEPTRSIPGAVQRVGTRGVQAVLAASIVQQSLCRPGSGYDGLVERVWTHMQRSAPIARVLAPAFATDPETAYLHALLHDVGKLVLFSHMTAMRTHHRRELRLPPAFFSALLWHLHEPVGGLAASRWGLGDETARVIGEHHRRPLPATPDPATEVVYAAEAIDLCSANNLRLDLDRIWREGGLTTDVAEVEARLPQLEL
jgi:HD-like signal output (HDOD) protein